SQADCGKSVSSRSTVTARSSAMAERERKALTRVVRRLGWGEQSAQGGVFEGGDDLGSGRAVTVGAGHGGDAGQLGRGGHLSGGFENASAGHAGQDSGAGGDAFPARGAVAHHDGG